MTTGSIVLLVASCLLLAIATVIAYFVPSQRSKRDENWPSDLYGVLWLVILGFDATDRFESNKLIAVFDLMSIVVFVAIMLYRPTQKLTVQRLMFLVAVAAMFSGVLSAGPAARALAIPIAGAVTLVEYMRRTQLAKAGG
jgi:hypothetical protein